MDFLLEYEYEKNSYKVEISEEERHGFGKQYNLRRHVDEAIANDAVFQARQDWLRYIGPIETFADANPYHGNFVSLVLPFTKPERVHVSTYFMEYAFLYDDICESANKALAMDPESDGLVLEQKKSVLGAKQMQSKIIMDLFDIDQACGQRILDKWKLGMSTTRKLKQTRPYTNLDEYVPFRSLDTGAPFVEAIMLFGMGVQLTDEDDETLKDIVAPAYAALGLANDYFSFDREYAERNEARRDSMEPEPMTNAVWLCMEWYNLDITQAKEMIRAETQKYEADFDFKKRTFLKQQPCPPERLWRCLDGLSQMIIGNIVWSLTCPRYHPELRYDANAGVENQFLHKEKPSADDVRAACTELKSSGASTPVSATSSSSGYYSSDTELEPLTPATTTGSLDIPDTKPTPKSEALVPEATPQLLSLTTVLDPYTWCATLPSKNVRNELVDALNFWLKVPKLTADAIKSIIAQLHTASLLLDDIEDSSSLRRGFPTAHKIYGIPETINSANFAIFEASDAIRRLPNAPFDLYSKHMRNLFTGQAHDLRWTRLNTCPSVDEYLEMIDTKTGGLFQMITGLLMAHSPLPVPIAELEKLVTLAGRLFQIRDDYQNLVSAEYTSQKGFCEDLDEGKFSYPLVDAFNLAGPEHASNVGILRSIRCAAAQSNGAGLSIDMKKVALQQLEACGSLARTKETIKELSGDVDKQIGMVEEVMGCENFILRYLIRKLAV